jgi:superfamily II DNA or RNA helicase
MSLAAALDELRRMARQEASDRVWSQGVSLARDHRVEGLSSTDEEIELDVRVPGRPTPFTVVLHPTDLEWQCDCPSKEAICSHAIAAILAMIQQQGKAEGGEAGDRGEESNDVQDEDEADEDEDDDDDADDDEAAPADGAAPAGEPGTALVAPAAAAAPAAKPRRARAAKIKAEGKADKLALPTRRDKAKTIRYLLEPSGAGLQVTRVGVSPTGTQNPIEGSVMSKLSQYATIDADLKADQLLSKRAPIAGDRLDLLLAALADARDVRWRGEPVTTDPEPVMPRVVVEDFGKGVRVRIEPDSEVSEVIAVGAVRCGRVLRPMGAIDICGPRMEKLPQRYDVGPSGYADLTSRMLPALAERMVVDILTTKLPAMGSREQPRMSFDVKYDGDGLSVLPLLVYGDPPRARIDGNRLVHLGGAVPIRDPNTERELIFRLRDQLNMVPGRRVELAGRDAAAAQGRLAEWIRREVAGARGDGAVMLDATVSIHGSAVDVEFASGGRRAASEAVVRAWQAGVDLVPLMGGGWGRVPMEWMSKHGVKVADLLAARGEGGRVPMYALPDLARLCEDLDQPPPPELSRLRPLLDGFEQIPHAAAPEPIASLLRPYQQRGVDWLAFCRRAGLGCVLADDMGLGKTIQALAAVQGKTLVVSPTSVQFNWAAEIARFRPDLKVHQYRGSRRSLEPDADITLTSYPLLRNDIDELADVEWDTVILDESQTIKNPESQVARAAYRLRAQWRLTLSGTPIENRLEELWSQLHFTNPGLLGARGDFVERWAEPISQGDAGVAARLRDRIRPFVLRRMKREVAPELPPRTDAILYVELDEAERLTYDAIRAATQRDVVAMLEAGGGVFAALEALLRLRQASCHLALLPGGMRVGVPREQRMLAREDGEGGDAEGADGEGEVARLGSSKVARLLSALSDLTAEGHRALVFSQWTSLLDLIEPHLNAASIGFVRLDGTTRDRAKVVEQFQDEAGPPVMLLSLKAGGTGLNLTAADHVFLIDPWWNPAVEEQAADRAHRIGQDKPVLVYRLVAKDTVEERILELQAKKRSLADSALGDASQAAAITRDDLLALLA